MDTTGLPPIESAGARVLILGSLPGVESVRQQQYYAHRQNLFWKILPIVLNEPAADDYAARVEMLKRHHVALWDVLHSSFRAGSLDTAIRPGSERPNDIGGLLARHPAIRTVFLNGQKAGSLFDRFITPTLRRPITKIVLPSTSPANAGIPIATKLERWSAVREAIGGR